MSARAEDAARALSREQPTTADAAVPAPANNGSADAEGDELPAPTVVVFDVDLLDTDPKYFEVNAEDLRHPLAPYLHPERDWPLEEEKGKSSGH